jgi:hypothetical protein
VQRLAAGRRAAKGMRLHQSQPVGKAQGEVHNSAGACRIYGTAGIHSSGLQILAKKNPTLGPKGANGSRRRWARATEIGKCWSKASQRQCGGAATGPRLSTWGASRQDCCGRPKAWGNAQGARPRAGLPPGPTPSLRRQPRRCDLGSQPRCRSVHCCACEPLPFAGALGTGDAPAAASGSCGARRVPRAGPEGGPRAQRLPGPYRDAAPPTAAGV